MFHRMLFAGDKQKQSTAVADRLQEILLGYLQGAESVAAWPGADGLTMEDVLDFYPKAVARGEVPEWGQLLNRHAELKIELHAWLAAKDRWQFAFSRRAEATA